MFETERRPCDFYRWTILLLPGVPEDSRRRLLPPRQGTRAGRRRRRYARNAAPSVKGANLRKTGTWR